MIISIVITAVNAPEWATVKQCFLRFMGDVILNRARLYYLKFQSGFQVRLMLAEKGC